MKNHYPHISHKYEYLVALIMCFLLANVHLFYIGRSGNAGVTIYGTQARIYLLLLAIAFIYPYFYKLHKKYWKTYKILVCGAIFFALMFLGCFFFSWWNPLMAIPLTVLWYPFHYQILKGLPCKKTDSEDNGAKQKIGKGKRT